jgi:hypothetical protein
MLRELDSVVLRDEHSMRSRILLWFYPNRGWKSDSHGAGDAAGAKPATGFGAYAAPSSSPRREETTHAV